MGKKPLVLLKVGRKISILFIHVYYRFYAINYNSNTGCHGLNELSIVSGIWILDPLVGGTVLVGKWLDFMDWVTGVRIWECKDSNTSSFFPLLPACSSKCEGSAALPASLPALVSSVLSSWTLAPCNCKAK